MRGEAIAANASRTVWSKPLLGVWSMNKAHPLWAAPLQFICTLSDSVQAFQETAARTAQSQSYVVDAPQMLCSTMGVVARLLENDHKHILPGGELTIVLASWFNISSAVAGPRFDLASNRSLHTCHACYATFMHAAAVEYENGQPILSHHGI